MGLVSIGWSEKPSLYESSVLGLETCVATAGRVGWESGRRGEPVRRREAGGRALGLRQGTWVFRVRGEPPESVSMGSTCSDLRFMRIPLAAVCKWTFVRGSM